ncbi:MAG: dipeptidyl-peptidase-3 [Sphingobacteriales bacterium]|jgi:dipeptidyl-peptidase-3
MKKLILFAPLLILMACQSSEKKTEEKKESSIVLDRFADLRILQYKVESFEELDAGQKQLVYFLSQAALSGRDIIYSQNYRHNIRIRKTLEAILEHSSIDKTTPQWEQFMTYTKRVWFSNGIHHHYSEKKMLPEFEMAYTSELINSVEANYLPLMENQDQEQYAKWLGEIIHNPGIDGKRVSKDANGDLVMASATNFYGSDLTQAEVEAFYDKKIDKKTLTPVSYGLNSQLVRKDGILVENVWKVDGMYGNALKQIVFWLEQAANVAENEIQKSAFESLIAYFNTGDLKKFDEYNIKWVADTESAVDVILGFIEVYGDPLGYRGTFESVIHIKDFKMTEIMSSLASEVQWFEDNSPLMEEHKKKNVKGVSYKVVSAAMEAGDASPSTPIGVNLPNSNWIRKDYGSKSVSLGNITEAYEEASGTGSLDEFVLDEAEKQRAKDYGKLSGKMHTAMHEVIGHASGQIEPGVGTPKQTLKNFSSTLEEGRADLVALYFVYDQKIVDMGLVPNLEVGMSEYEGYIRNGMMLQLRRLELGEDIEEDHMRNRQLVAKWAYEKGKADNVIEKKVIDGKTYFVVNDYDKLRDIFGQLLREIQRIKSQGDYAAAKALVEGYGVKVDQELHKEVLARYEKLDIAPYSGFVQPNYEVVTAEDGSVVDVKMSYETNYVNQMMRFGKDYSFVSVDNK